MYGHLICHQPITSQLFEEKESTSRVRKSFGSYTFRIEGYIGLGSRVGESTESPEFELCGHLWQLRIFPGGSLEAHRGYVSYYLASKSTRSARASYKLVVVNQLPQGVDETFASTGVRLFEAKGVQIDGWGRDKFMTVAALMNPDSGFLVNDTVIFKVEVTVYGELEMSTGAHPCRGHDDFPTLSRCYRRLWESGEDADVAIICDFFEDAESSGGGFAGDITTLVAINPKPVGIFSSKTPSVVAREQLTTEMAESIANQVLRSEVRDEECLHSESFTDRVSLSAAETQPAETVTTSKMPEIRQWSPSTVVLQAHRCVLKARSPVFHAMLSCRMTEDTTNQIVITDIAPQVLRELLYFLYTDSFSTAADRVLETLAEPLLVASAKYAVPVLQRHCEVYLQQHLAVATTVHFLQLADRFHAEKLKSSVLTFIAQHGAAVLQSHGFVELDNSSDENDQFLREELLAVVDTNAKRKYGLNRSNLARKFGNNNGVSQSATGNGNSANFNTTNNSNHNGSSSSTTNLRSQGLSGRSVSSPSPAAGDGSPERRAERTTTLGCSIQSALLKSILLRSNVATWTRYWNTVRIFLLGQLSKLELDDFLKENLTVDEIELHNCFILAMLEKVTT